MGAGKKARLAALNATLAEARAACGCPADKGLVEHLRERARAHEAREERLRARERTLGAIREALAEGRGPAAADTGEGHEIARLRAGLAEYDTDLARRERDDLEAYLGDIRRALRDAGVQRMHLADAVRDLTRERDRWRTAAEGARPPRRTGDTNGGGRYHGVDATPLGATTAQ